MLYTVYIIFNQFLQMFIFLFFCLFVYSCFIFVYFEFRVGFVVVLPFIFSFVFENICCSYRSGINTSCPRGQIRKIKEKLVMLASLLEALKEERRWKGNFLLVVKRESPFISALSSQMSYLFQYQFGVKVLVVRQVAFRYLGTQIPTEMAG